MNPTQQAPRLRRVQTQEEKELWNVLRAGRFAGLRFWNRQWHENRDGVLLSIWQALHLRTGHSELERKKQNQRFIAPSPDQLTPIPHKP